jgi:hypothetical protein
MYLRLKLEGRLRGCRLVNRLRQISGVELSGPPRGETRKDWITDRPLTVFANHA